MISLKQVVGLASGEDPPLGAPDSWVPPAVVAVMDQGIQGRLKAAPSQGGAPERTTAGCAVRQVQALALSSCQSKPDEPRAARYTVEVRLLATH